MALTNKIIRFTTSCAHAKSVSLEYTNANFAFSRNVKKQRKKKPS